MGSGRTGDPFAPLGDELITTDGPGRPAQISDPAVADDSGQCRGDPEAAPGKPFDRERFALTLGRARQQLANAAASGGNDLQQQLSSLLADLKPTRAASPDRIAIRNGGKIVFVAVEDIDWLQAADN